MTRDAERDDAPEDEPDWPEMTAAEYAAWRLLVDTPGGTWGRQARRADERRPACLN
jgi:hypothetical protein